MATVDNTQQNNVVAEPTNNSVESTTPVEQEQLPLEDQIRNQIDYYLSRQNLSKDHYLTQRMNNEMFVPLEVIANFKKVKNLTTDINLIIEVMSKSSNVILDESKTHIKPAFKLQRNIIILRDILSETPVEEVKSIFTATGKNIADIKSEIGNYWFITFENEQDALEAHDIIIKQTFKDKQIKARIKTESLIKNPAAVTPNRPYTPYQPNTNNTNTHNNRYYNNQQGGGKPWNRTGGYPYGGWDSQQQQGTHQPYDPSKSTGERKPYRGGLNKDGTPRTSRQNRGENTQFVNNKDTTSTATDATTADKSNDNTNKRLGRKHSSKQHNSTPSNNTSTTTTTTSPSTSSNSSSPSTSPVQTSTPATTTPAAVSLNNTTAANTTTPATSNNTPTERKSTSQHKSRKPKKLAGSPSDEQKEIKPAVPQTPPGPQHFPPLNGSTEQPAPVENKKKEWGPADKKMTVPAPVVTAPATLESTQPSAAVAAPATTTPAPTTTAASSSSPAKSSKKSSPSSQPKKSPSKNADAEKKSKSASEKSQKKPASASTAATTATTEKPSAASAPATEEKKSDASSDANEKKQPTYADIIAMNAAKAAAAANGTATATTTDTTTTPAAVEQQ